MPGARRITAAAIGAAATVGLLFGILAAAADGRVSALVELQVAPRGPGSVSVTPTGAGDASPCQKAAGNEQCVWRFERGTSVQLTAAPDSGAGRSFARWSDPQCGSASSCRVTLEDDVTSVVAVFSPLVLAVKFSNPDGGATIASNPAGEPCPNGRPQRDNDNEVFCRLFPALTQVQLTITPGATPFQGWTETRDALCTPTSDTTCRTPVPVCEPATAPTCTILVADQETWLGARFGSAQEPGLPPTISVEFKVRKAGDGSGRVTATRVDCGNVCATTFGFGRRVTLSATADPGSVFGGWSGVCAAAQTSCTLAAGPVTTIRPVFRRDSSPPTPPGGLTVTAVTRTSIRVAWIAATDDTGVAGYRVYVDEAAVADTRELEHMLVGLRCGRRYRVAVDAVDVNGNRSASAAVGARTRPCPLAARLAGVAMRRIAGTRVVEVKLRVNRPTTAQLRLLRGRTVVASGRFRVVPGTNTLRLRLHRRVAAGPHRLTIVLANPDGRALVVPGRGVLVGRP